MADPYSPPWPRCCFCGSVFVPAQSWSDGEPAGPRGFNQTCGCWDARRVKADESNYQRLALVHEAEEAAGLYIAERRDERGL